VISGQRYGARGAKLYSIQDATIASTYAILATEALGLATTWVGAFDEEKVKSILKSDASHIPIAILPIGYGAKGPFLTPREPLNRLSREI
jgi:nitroreductase